MKSETSLLYSVFVLFMGFLIFVSAVANKQFSYSHFLAEYYVLFTMLGIIIAVIGSAKLLVWHVDNRKPYHENVPGNHFPSYLALGSILALLGLTCFVFLSKSSRLIYLISMSSSISGIFALLIGLYFFVKEIIFKRKIFQHS